MRSTIFHRRRLALRPFIPLLGETARRKFVLREHLAFWSEGGAGLGRRLVLLCVFCFGLFNAVPVRAEFTFWPIKFKAEVSPWRAWGYTNYQFTSNMVKNRKSNIGQISMINANLSKSATGYLWKPWVVQWNGMMAVGGSTTQRKVFATSNTQDVGEDTLTRNLYGGIDFTVLPESRFPLKVYYNKTVSDSSDGPAGQGGQGTVRENVGLSQDYRNLEGDLRVALRLTYGFDQLGSKNVTGLYGVSIPSIDRRDGYAYNEGVSLAISKTMGEHVADLIVKRAAVRDLYQGVKRSNLDDAVVFNHTLNRGKKWSANTLGNYSRIHTISESTQRDEAFLTARQVGNSAFWRSEEMPLFLSGSVRVASNTQQITRGGGGPTNIRRANVVTGGNYQFSPEWTANAAMSANHEESETMALKKISRDSTQSLSTSYSPQRVPFGDFMHNWFATTTTNTHQATGFLPTKVFNQGIGQALTREVNMGNAALINLAANQVEFANYTSGIKPLYGVNHGISGRYTSIGPARKAYADVSLTDSRSLGNVVNDGQSLNTQFSIEGVLPQKINWQGHLTSQVNRAYAENKAVLGVYSSADIMFQKGDLFGLRGLLFTSKLQIDASNQFLPIGNVVGVVADRESRNFLNFLDFNIGKLSARMTLGVTESQGKSTPYERNTLILFQLQRFFDTTFTSWSLPEFLLPPTNKPAKREKDDD
ncbi:MAG: hypothetical protein HQL64_03690 [Magnetococcales bacterium]|nr:hypothetical protein [Magnetococcales bacterium]